MNTTKLIKKLEKRIEQYEEERAKEGNEILKEFYGIKITELRICILDICDWVIDEIRGGGD